MHKDILGLDVGAKRIGVARVNTFVKIPQALKVIPVDGDEITAISDLVKQYEIDIIVVGWPRNMSGEITKQTNFTASFIKKLENEGYKVVRQDESLTSVEAEAELKSRKKSFSKADIDSQAAVIILEDYLRGNNEI